MRPIPKTRLEDAPRREVAADIVASLLAGCLLVVGIAMLFRWSPIADAYVFANLPHFAMPVLGIAVIVGAGLLFVASAAFYVSIGAAILMFCAAVAYLRNGDVMLAVVPALVGVLAVAVMALRSNAPREQVARRRARRAERRVAHV